MRTVMQAQCRRKVGLLKQAVVAREPDVIRAEIGRLKAADGRRGGEVAKIIQHYAADGNGLRAVMLERLGPKAWHDSPAQTMATLEQLEETARLCSGGLT